MMGKLPSGQDHLFYAFNLESVVPQKHLLRSIARSSSQNLGLAEWPVHALRQSVKRLLT